MPKPRKHRNPAVYAQSYSIDLNENMFCDNVLDCFFIQYSPLERNDLKNHGGTTCRFFNDLILIKCHPGNASVWSIDMSETAYYVYALKDPRSSPALPFYIGKGTGVRAYDHLVQPDKTRKGARIQAIESQ